MTEQGAPAGSQLEIRVRYVETDRMGFVHHSRYFVYFEMGRTEMLRQGGIAYRDLEDAGVFFVVTRASSRFLAPARYDDLLVVTTTIQRITTARIDHSYTLRHKESGRLLAEGQTTVACVDRQGEVAPIPDSVRQAAQRQAQTTAG